MDAEGIKADDVSFKPTERNFGVSLLNSSSDRKSYGVFTPHPSSPPFHWYITRWISGEKKEWWECSNEDQAACVGMAFCPEDRLGNGPCGVNGMTNNHDAEILEK